MFRLKRPGFILLLGLVASGALSTQAFARPDPYADLVVESVTLSDTGGCLAEVTWSGLNGGKPLFVQVRLTFNNGSSYQTSFAAGSNEIHKTKQNSGALAVSIPGAAAVDGTTDHMVQVTFMNRDGTPIGTTHSSAAAC
jgi:hypothetical protein